MLLFSFLQEKLGKEVKERLPVFIAQLEKVLGTDDFFGGSKVMKISDKVYLNWQNVQKRFPVIQFPYLNF